MYRHLLIAIDGSALASRALEHGLGLARDLQAQVTIVTVSEGWSAFDLARETRMGHADAVQRFQSAATAVAKEVLDAAAKTAADRGVSAGTLHVPDRTPAEGIVETATARGCDLIVMGSHGRRALGRMFLGSQAVEVLTHSTVPALIVR